MKIKLHQPYDKLHKSFTKAFGNETLKFLQIDSEVKDFLATEIISIENQTKFVDMLIKTVDDLLIHIEFYSGNIEKSIMYRNNAYTADLANITKQDIIPIIISLGDKDKSVLEIKNENNHYAPNCFFLREYDGDKILKRIKNKLLNNKALTGEDLFFLVFLPFTSHKRSDEKMAEEMFEITNQVPLSDEQKYHIKKCQKIILEIYFDDNEEKMTELEGLINMQCSYFNRYEEKIVTEAIKQGIEKGVQQGIQEGIQEGMIKNSKEIAKKYTLKEIAQITNLDTKTIQQL